MNSTSLVRSVLLLISALLCTTSNTHLQGQESLFEPGVVSTAVQSVSTESPYLLVQPGSQTEIGTGSEIFNAAATSNTASLPAATSYPTPTFGVSDTTTFAQSVVTPQTRSRGGRGGIRNYFREASNNAPTEGFTVSFLGGEAFDNFTDEFGRTLGRPIRAGRTLGFGIGKRFGPRFRTDFELSWRDSDAAGYLNPVFPGEAYEYYEGDLEHFSGIINFYHDFHRPRGSFLTPYVGIGLGVTQQDLQLSFGDPGGNPFVQESSETFFAFQGIVGVSARVTARNELFAEYRGFSITDDALSKTINEAIFGWRYTF